MILKIILLIIVVVVIYFFFFRKVLPASKQQNETNLKDKEEIMVECHKCNVYTSNKEAIIKDGNFYCSKECAGVK